MSRTAWTGLGLLLLVPVGWALADNDKPKLDPAAKPAVEYARLTKEFNEKLQAFSEQYQKAESDAEREQLQRMRPKPQDYARLMVELADKNPTDPTAPEALVWVVRHATGPEANTVTERLLKDYLDSKAIGGLCDAVLNSRAVNAGSPEIEKYLRTIVEKSPHREVQGKACFRLGQYLKYRAELPGGTADRPEELINQAEELLDRVVKEYPDMPGGRLGTIRETARAELFEIRKLAIGKAAPEIEGEDVDGQRFKLSDYKGKVVVLDFWGSW
jgi:hypothetical protein